MENDQSLNTLQVAENSRFSCAFSSPTWQPLRFLILVPVEREDAGVMLHFPDEFLVSLMQLFHVVKGDSALRIASALGSDAWRPGLTRK